MAYFTGFLSGSISSLFWHLLPNYIVIGLLFIGSILLLAWQRTWGVTKFNLPVFFLAGFMLGAGWLGLFGQIQHTKLFHEKALRSSIMVVGEIDSLMVEHEPQNLVLTINRTELGKWFYPKKVKLSWYQPTWNLKQGQKVHLEVKLKPPFGLANEGGFSYQTWLLSQSIIAKGYVVPDGNNRLLKQQMSVRQQVLDQLTTMNLSHVKWILALSIGYRGLLDSKDWLLMQQTGLAHLISISGLHLAVAFGLAYGVFGLGLSSLLAVIRRHDVINVHYVSLVGALAVCFAYSYLAGFSVPTLRAWFALGFVVSMSLLGRHITMRSGFLISISALIMIFPSSLLSVSFWLSVTAVVAILFAMWRLEPLRSEAGLVRKLVYGAKIQGILTLLITPLAIYHFGNVPLYSLLFNLLLVPFVSLVLVPMCLVSTLILLVLPGVAAPLFELINGVVKWGFDGANVLLESATLAWSVPAFSLVSLVFVLVAVIWMLLPPMPVSKLGLSVLLLPLIFDIWRSPEKGWFVHVLDVGQGLSVVVEKHNRAMVYDTGPAFESGFNMADAAILPFLKQRGVDRIDHLVVSHQDNDHSGGQSILQPFVDKFTAHCKAGTRWEWQQIEIKVLWPPSGQPFNGGNANSCVLMLSDGNVSVLLPGDIEKAQERQLVVTYDEALKADILVAPHHGSATSSTRLFLRHVRPRWAVFSRGFENRWGFPKSQVIESYRKYGVNLLDTVENGQVSFHIQENSLSVERFRQHVEPFWYRNFPF